MSSTKASFLLGLSPEPASSGGGAPAADRALPIQLSALAMRLQHVPAGSPLLVVAPHLVGRRDSHADVVRQLAHADPDTQWHVGMAWPSFAVQDNDVALPLPVQQLLLSAAEAGRGDKHPHGALRVRPLPSEALPAAQAVSMRLEHIVDLPRSSEETPSFLALPPALPDAESLLLSALLKESLTSRAFLHYGARASVELQQRRYVLRLAAIDGRDGVRPHASHVGCTVTNDTVVQLASPDPSGGSAHRKAGQRAGASSSAPYSDLGGLQEEVREMRKLIELPLLRPELFEQYGLTPPRGVLLYGPPGTGKTSLARAVCDSVGANVVQINGPELGSAYHGETEAKLRTVFEEAHRREPCIVVIDEIDALAPRRDAGASEDTSSAAGEVDRRVVATLLTLLDGMGSSSPASSDPALKAGANGHHRARVAVIAATNRPNALDPALRRPGRLDREIELGVPTLPARADILRVLLQKVPHALTPEGIDIVASKTHAYVGADLAAVVREAAMRAIGRMDVLAHAPAQHGHQGAQDDVDTLASNLAQVGLSASADDPTPIRVEPVCQDDLLDALNVVRPSGLRELAVEVPRVSWEDVAIPDGSDTLHMDSGAWDVTAKLRQAVETPLKHGASFARLGITAPRGVLLYGPPGCSKTLLARALATESGANFVAVKGPELYSMYVGESERRTRALFRKARAAAPCILFFDEIDALTTARSGMGSGAGGGGEGGAVSDRLLGTLLTELDGLDTTRTSAGEGVVVLAATNRPDALDSALLRPGRLDVHLYVPPPPRSQRLSLLRKSTKSMPLGEDVDLANVAAACEGCSGADIVALVQAAGMAALRRDVHTASVQSVDWEVALKSTRRSITPEMLGRFGNWRSNVMRA